ncbi:amidohydrolase family protein [Mesorhizobium sp. B2-4-12]|uniref:amidohydrolase family protein n=1 Tax=Mesorhizobium sp. B2-4-12 TaxID=2589937 RepID=UPI001FEDC50D|nr:amidohydrolase family protein [Mesorhizobium sp. B2-4-12]
MARSSTATTRLIAYIVDNAIDILGSDHLMFGSNFPIEKLWTSHAELINAHRAAVAKHDATAQADIFWNTAERVYKPV